MKGTILRTLAALACYVIAATLMDQPFLIELMVGLLFITGATIQESQFTRGEKK